MEFNCPSLSRHRALNISMENPEIQGRIKIERVIPVEIFRKKSNTFRGITFFPVFTETNEFFCNICLDYKCQASCREKAKNLPVFCKWYNSIPFLFSVPKKYQYHSLTEFFTEISVLMVSTPCPCPCLPKCFLQVTFVVLVVIPCNLVIRIPTKRLREYH